MDTYTARVCFVVCNENSSCLSSAKTALSMILEANLTPFLTITQRYNDKAVSCM
uniref:Uncharacterized protein n=1 Tax=Arundo donax TaxID=35708 RepID=A0A0A9A2N0_ARUDO